MGVNRIVLARFTAKIIFLNSNSNYWGRYSGGGDVMTRTVRVPTPLHSHHADMTRSFPRMWPYQRR
jgi:hypothetical protein